MFSKLKLWSKRRRLAKLTALDKLICDEISKIDHQIRMAKERDPHDDAWLLKQKRKFRLEELDEIRYEKGQLDWEIEHYEQK